MLRSYLLYVCGNCQGDEIQFIPDSDRKKVKCLSCLKVTKPKYWCRMKKRTLNPSEEALLYG